MDKGLLRIISTGCGQLVKMLITLEPDGIFGSNFAYLFILTFNCPATGMQNGDDAMTSIILADRGLLVKMLITLETHHIF